MLRSLLTTATLTLSLLGAAHAHDYSVGSIRIDHPWARATVPGQSTGSAYLKLENRGGADRLLSVHSPAAASTELHMMSMDGNIMRMREVDDIELPAGQTVELKPGGLHLMLRGLKAPLKQGERVPLTLRFEKAGETSVHLTVESLTSTGGEKPGAAPPQSQHHHH